MRIGVRAQTKRHGRLWARGVAVEPNYRVSPILDHGVLAPRALRVRGGAPRAMYAVEEHAEDADGDTLHRITKLVGGLPGDRIMGKNTQITWYEGHEATCACERTPSFCKAHKLAFILLDYMYMYVNVYKSIYKCMYIRVYVYV